MPVYTVFHRSCIPIEHREWVADRLTALHVSITGAEPDAVKVMFIEFDADSIFIGGKQTTEYVRAVGQIRQGRTEDQKKAILYGMYEILRLIVHDGEIQTQIVEIDDSKTVMTNGVLNV